jgi:putative endonuclease
MGFNGKDDFSSEITVSFGARLQIPKYPIPPFLEGILNVSQYAKWLKVKAQNLRNRDIRCKRSYPLENSVARYRKLVHDAVLDNGQTDPYTGDTLDWNLAGGHEVLTEGAGGADKTMYLSPSVDHIDPDSSIPAIEICSWIVNECKNSLAPREFVELCRKVVVYRKSLEKKQWFLYILECGDGSLYTGISNDVHKRFACHQLGKGAKYTRTHQPVLLRYVEPCGTQGQAMRRERAVKKLSKKKKLELIGR